MLATLGGVYNSCLSCQLLSVIGPVFSIKLCTAYCASRDREGHLFQGWGERRIKIFSATMAEDMSPTSLIKLEKRKAAKCKNPSPDVIPW